MAEHLGTVLKMDHLAYLDAARDQFGLRRGAARHRGRAG